MPDAPDLADRIDDLLPQTQCTRCGYPGCRPYAEAIAIGAADINRCPPGGEATLATLARMLDRDPPALDTARGLPGPLRVAHIDERACIGCTLCISACPVDAIIGAPKRMHDVLGTLCSGCDLCVEPCPVDCIDDGAGRPRMDACGCQRRARTPRCAGPRLANEARAAARDVEARKRKTAVTQRLRGHARVALPRVALTWTGDPSDGPRRRCWSRSTPSLEPQ